MGYRRDLVSLRSFGVPVEAMVKDGPLQILVACDFKTGVDRLGPGNIAAAVTDHARKSGQPIIIRVLQFGHGHGEVLRDLQQAIRDYTPYDLMNRDYVRCVDLQSPPSRDTVDFAIVFYDGRSKKLKNHIAQLDQLEIPIHCLGVEQRIQPLTGHILRDSTVYTANSTGPIQPTYGSDTVITTYSVQSSTGWSDIQPSSPWTAKRWTNQPEGDE